MRYKSRRELLKGCATAFALGIASSGPFARANDVHIGAPAPPATLGTLEGRRISTTDLVGNVVVLTFWATWCEPCREELPLLSRYLAEHADSGLRVLGFSLDTTEDLEKVRQVARDLSFPVGLLANSSAPGYGRIWRLPVNFTIDRSGRIVEDGWKEKKPIWTQERLEQILTPLLSAPPKT